VTPIARELESARKQLLDLTLRNRLLHYRPSGLRSIRVIGELPAEISGAGRHVDGAGGRRVAAHRSLPADAA
jgi:hypothetical protein